MGLRFAPLGRRPTRKFRRLPPPEGEWESQDFAEDEDNSRDSGQKIEI